MPLLVKKKVRAVGSKELLGPVLAVEKIEIVHYVRGRQMRGLELFCLEDGSRKQGHELFFVELDEELLIAMRLEALILAQDKGVR